VQSEEEWEMVGDCVHCNSPIYAMNGELRFTGGDCQCELRGIACLDTKRALTRRGMARARPVMVRRAMARTGMDTHGIGTADRKGTKP